MKKMKRMKTLKILVILPFVLLLLSCDNILNDSQKSGSVLIVAKITGQTAAGSEADFYESDVQDDATGTVYEDVAVATLEAKLKEPESIVGPSYNNNVLIYAYRISYAAVLPSGSTVPISFQGSMNVVIDIDATVDVDFILVRAAAKNEAPLQNLKGTPDALLVDATITFYCKDLSGKAVKDVTGQDPTATISINFADWVN